MRWKLETWVKRIVGDVSRTCGVPTSAILDHDKGYALVARHLLFWSTRELIPGDPSWRKLGELLGFDHGGVRYGWLRVNEDLKKRDAYTVLLVERLLRVAQQHHPERAP